MGARNLFRSSGRWSMVRRNEFRAPKKSEMRTVVEPMIEAINLTKIFHDRKRGDIRAVDGINFRCQPGEIYGLLGANGAGKTTTLRLLATILQPSDGTAQVAGGDNRRQPEKVPAHVRFLSTATAPYCRLTARETVEY